MKPTVQELARQGKQRALARAVKIERDIVKLSRQLETLLSRRNLELMHLAVFLAGEANEIQRAEIVDLIRPAAFAGKSPADDRAVRRVDEALDGASV